MYMTPVAVWEGNPFPNDNTQTVSKINMTADKAVYLILPSAVVGMLSITRYMITSPSYSARNRSTDKIPSSSQPISLHLCHCEVIKVVNKVVKVVNKVVKVVSKVVTSH